MVLTTNFQSNMKVCIENFKSIVSETVVLDDDKMTLIRGPSGSGKSTVLESILFAITGKPNRCKPLGTRKATKVTIVMADATIMRRTGPCRLTLDRKDGSELLEDDDAQMYINGMFGAHFSQVSFIPQDTSNSFIRMSPTAKLDFLESFAIGTSATSMKVKVKAYVRECKTLEIQAKAQTDLLRRQVSACNGQLTEPQFPVKCKASSRDVVAKNQSVRKKNATARLKKLRAQKKRETAYDTAERLLLQAVKMSTHQTDEIASEIEEHNNNITDVQTRILTVDEVQKLRSNIRQLAQREELAVQTKIRDDAVDRLKVTLEKERVKCQSEIEQIERSLYADYPRNELEKDIEDTEKACDIATQITLLQDACTVKSIAACNEKLVAIDSDPEIERLSTTVQALETACRVDFNCPKCEAGLCFNTATREVTDSEGGGKDDLSVAFKTVKTFKAAKARLDAKRMQNAKAKQRVEEDLTRLRKIDQLRHETEVDLSGDTCPVDVLEELRGYQNEQMFNEKKVKDLTARMNSGKYGHAVKCLMKDVERSTAVVDRLTQQIDDGDCPECIECLETLQQRLDMHEDATRELERLEGSIMSLGTKQRSIKAVIDKKMADFEAEWPEPPEQREVSLDKQIEEQEQLFSAADQMEGRIAVWAQRQQEYDHYTKLQTSLDRSNECLSDAQNKVRGATELKQHVLEAESLALLSIVESINSHAAIYIDEFFQDDPIEVRLNTFTCGKTTKKVKPSIQMDILYKNNETKFENLSGGEQARVVIAFNLALCDMFDSKLIMLDEVTANLDADLTETILESVKQHMPRKIVVVVAHQCVCGIFDQVIPRPV